MPVAGLDGAPDRCGGGALLSTDVQRQPRGANEHSHHPGVTGQPASRLHTDRAGERQLPAGHAGCAALGTQRHQVDVHSHLCGRTPHGRQPPGLQRLPGEFDEGTAHPLPVRPEVAGRPIGVHQRLQCGVQGLSADRVQMPGQVHPPTGTDGHPQHPRHPGRLVQGPVRIDARHPSANRLCGVLRPQQPGGLRQHPIGGGQVDALRLGRGNPRRRHRPCHHIHMCRRHRTPGVGGGKLRQIPQTAAGPNECGRLTARQPAMSGQPGLHRRHAVCPLRLAPLRCRDRSGQQRGHLVDPTLQHRKSVEQLSIGEPVGVERAEIHGGELVQQRPQL